MPEIFEKTVINHLELDNRCIRSATWSGVCDNKGAVTDKAVEFYSVLAGGGIGLITTGFQYVMPNGIARTCQMGNYSDDLLGGLTRLVDAIHSRNGKVIPQLVHTGSKANPDLFPEKGELWGASAIRDPDTGRTPKEMTRKDIDTLVQAYADAASRSQKAGFDGIQLHGAHGYGVNQFLSGFFNRRSDEYGGDITKRYRFLGDVLQAVRNAVGKDYLISIKLSGNDFFEAGLTTEEAVYVACRLEEDGIDSIEVSGGSRASSPELIPSRTKILKEKDEAYLSELAAAFKQAVKVPIITVGGVRSPDVISKILSEGVADYVAMCRPFIREPHLVNRWKSGDLKKAKCISCNGCYETGEQGLGVSCKVERAKQKKS
jgi:2,4-dienoyl-CoA reductase-like NADH-dependent reductase (Old Yellow Enzyme family)